MRTTLFGFWCEALARAIHKAWHRSHVVYFVIVLASGGAVISGFHFEQHALIWVPAAAWLAFLIYETLYAAFRMYRDEASDPNSSLERVVSNYEVEIDRIVSHYESADKRFPIVLAERVVVTIEKNGDVRTVDERSVHAPANCIQNFIIDRFTGPESARTFQNLEFELHSPQHRMAYLPCGKTSGGEFPVLLVFLPALLSPAPKAVDFSVAWRWPQAYGNLLDEKIQRDWYSTLVNSDRPVPQLTIDFRIHVDIRPLKLEDKGTWPGMEEIVPPDLADPNYRRYRWVARNVPGGRTVACWLIWQ